MSWQTPSRSMIFRCFDEKIKYEIRAFETDVNVGGVKVIVRLDSIR
jgi:hypothetical protein